MNTDFLKTTEYLVSHSLTECKFGKSKHQQKVEEFMRLAGQECPDKPTIPSEEVRRLRAKLILEEALETIEALGFDVTVNSTYTHVNMNDIVLLERGDPDLEEIIDGCCDLSVVVSGTLTAVGVPDVEFQEEVNNNNLAKFGPGHTIREDGKLVKPPGHKPPKIKELLEELEQNG